MTVIYETKGKLTEAIPQEHVAEAMMYLMVDHEGNLLHMEQYLDQPLNGVVTELTWKLDKNGHDYTVRAIASRELSADELRVLSLEVSGQNSDGLGESFEQQDFAWSTEEYECGECDSCVHGWSCDEEQDGGHMISFDWKTNELPWTRVG